MNHSTNNDSMSADLSVKQARRQVYSDHRKEKVVARRRQRHRTNQDVRVGRYDTNHQGLTGRDVS